MPSAAALDLAEFLAATKRRACSGRFLGARRWGIHRATFREGGLPHQLLVVTDLTRALREEELQAWQRLVRVLGHELNNSLAPIKSIAGSLETLVKRDPLPERLARGHQPRAVDHRDAERRPEPVHGRLRAAGEAAASAAGAGGRRRVDSQRGGPGTAHSPGVEAGAGVDHSRAIGTNWNKC